MTLCFRAFKILTNKGLQYHLLWSELHLLLPSAFDDENIALSWYISLEGSYGDQSQGKWQSELLAVYENPLARSTGRHEPIDNEKKESLTSRLKGDYVKGRRRV